MEEPSPQFPFICKSLEANTHKFSAAVALLSVNSQDIVLEVNNTQVILHGINESQNVFTAAYFETNFFSEYQLFDESTSITSKFPSKSLAQAFRTLKNVEAMQLYFVTQDGADLLVVKFFCKQGK